MQSAATWTNNRTNKPESRVWLVGSVLISAFLLRVLCIFVFGSHLNADAAEMGTLARNIVAGNGYQLSFLAVEQPTAMIMPLEAYFFALGYYMWGETPLAYAVLILFRCAVSVATAYIVYRIVKSEFSERFAVLALVAAAFHPPLIYFSAIGPTLTRAPFSVFIVCLVVWCLLHFARHPSLPRSLLIGTVFGLGLLMQGNLLGCFPVAWVWMAYVLRRPRTASARGRRWVLLVAMPLAMIVVVAPWTVRNYLALGGFVPLRTGVGTQFWLGNNPMATGDDLWVTWDAPQFEVEAARTLPPDLLAKMPQLSEIERDRLLLREALAFIAAHPDAYLRLTLARLRLFWLGQPRQYTLLWKQVVYRLYTWYSVALVPLGLTALVFRRDRVVGLFMLMASSFTLLYCLVTFGYNYYRLDSELLCLILALFTLNSSWEWWQARREWIANSYTSFYPSLR